MFKKKKKDHKESDWRYKSMIPNSSNVLSSKKKSMSVIYVYIAFQRSTAVFITEIDIVSIVLKTC